MTASPTPRVMPDDVEPHVVNWATLSADEAALEWEWLDEWVYWLRDTFGLTPQELPPFWHRHDELVWELSALRTSWQAAHDRRAAPGAPGAWLRELHMARPRLKHWVQDSGTELTQDRATRRVVWPGEPPVPSPERVPITDRAADFRAYVAQDVAERRAAEAAISRMGPALGHGGGPSGRHGRAPSGGGEGAASPASSDGQEGVT